MGAIQIVTTPQKELARILKAGQKQIQDAMGDAMTPEFMIRLAVTALHQTPELQNCSMVSIVNSVMLAAQLRLEINTSLGHAWLIPYKQVCTFQPGYRGLIELAHRSNEVHDVGAHVVYRNDVFEIEYGDTPHCLHKPAMQDRGAWIGAYAAIRYKQGPPSTLFMLREEIEEIRDKCSQSKDSQYSPWKRFEGEMVRKTPTKRHLKYCRLTIQDLSRAVGLDDQAEVITSGQTPNGYRPEITGQELAIEGELLEMAEESTHNLRGSQEAADQVAEQKLATLQGKPGEPPSSHPRLTDAELDARNRQLDREIMEREQQKGATPERPSPATGKRRLF